jgi:aspartate dehydrogenase
MAETKPSTAAARPIRLGIVGAGRIARGVITAVEAGEAGPFRICGILKRDPTDPAGLGLPIATQVGDFLATRPELVIELGGPDALRAHAASILAEADLWSISGAVIADAAFERDIAEVTNRSGHRLRFVSGAIAGLDAVAAAATVPGASVTVEAGLVGLAADAPPDFAGSAREVLQRFHGVNVIAAVAVAGTGLDATHVRYHAHVPGRRRQFTVFVECEHGQFEIVARPLSSQRGGTAIVAASVIAALRQSQRLVSAT